MRTLVVTPAYGRDYKSKKAASQDWKDGKDFVSRDFSMPDRPLSIRDTEALKSEGFGEVQIRYKRMMNLVVVKL
jgi:hypothetical protein